MHAEASEVNRAAFQAEEVAPQLDALNILLGVAVHGLYIGAIDRNARQMTPNVGRRQQLICVKQQVISFDLYPIDVALEQICRRCVRDRAGLSSAISAH